MHNDNPVIEKTSNYQLFKWVFGNRNRNDAHIKRLINAIEEDANVIKYNPILVNENYEIIDGQHRFQAIQRLNLPVYYIKIEGLGLRNAQNLNKLSKPWTPTDYARSYAEMGNEHYQFYLELKSLYKLNHDVLMSYISLNNPITSEMFRAGKMVSGNNADTIVMCNILMDFGKVYPRYKNRSFALAVLQMVTQDFCKYDHERMMTKLTQRPNSIEDRALPNDYIRDLEALYNHGLQVKVRFA